MTPIAGIAVLASRYDGFIVDLWGVVHDGVTPYPGAAHALRSLLARGARVVLLSNAPRRAEAAAAALAAMGMGPDHYSAIMTSGEAVRSALLERTDPFFAGLGSRFFHLGPERDANLYAGLPFARVASLAEADWVLNTGPDDLGSQNDLAAFEPILSEAAVLDLPMVCANPDLVVIRDGQQILCAGALAQRYQSLGGRIALRGKPDPAIYPPVFDLLGISDRSRLLAIGDSLMTDIQGAEAVGIDSLWILGGIHAASLGLAEGELAPPDALAREAAPYGVTPRFVASRFAWDLSDRDLVRSPPSAAAR